MVVLGGIIVFNLFLLSIICIAQRRRRSVARREKQFTTQSDDTLASVPSNVTIAPFPLQVPPGASQVPPYMQTTKALQNSSTSLLAVPPSFPYTSSSASLQTPPKVYTRREVTGKTLGADLRRTSAQRSIRHPHNAPLHIRKGPSILRIVSLQRNNSIDSVSIYSSASAPIDGHECMFQPMTLESIPSSAPANIPTYPDVPQPQPNQSDTRVSWPTSTHIREALAPETYAKPLPRTPPSPRLLPVSEYPGIPKVHRMPERMKVPPMTHLPSVALPLKLQPPPSSFRVAY